MGIEAYTERWDRWQRCSLCKQGYHGVVACALGWACWKTYLGRPEANNARCLAMNVLGAGLGAARHGDDALSVYEANLSLLRRIGDTEHNMLIAQGNLACTYEELGRYEEALRLQRAVYSGWLRLKGEEHEDTLREANNYADTLVNLKRFQEAKSLLHNSIPVARRNLGESKETTLMLRWLYAQSLYMDDDATLDDLREAVNTLKDAGRIARRVLGGAHPLTTGIERCLRNARDVLEAREAGHQVLFKRA